MIPRLRILLSSSPSCSPGAARAQEPAPSTLPAPSASPAPPEQDTPEANKALVRRYLQILSGGTLADLDQLVGADFVDRTPGVPGNVYGPEAIRASQRLARELFENIRYNPEDLIAEGDRVAARYTVRATRKGAGRGGKPVEVTGVTLFRIAAGKVREAWIVNDQIELFRQLGFTLQAPQAPQAGKSKPR